MLQNFFLLVLFALTILIAVYLYRAIRGPTTFDRLLGLNGVSTATIVLSILIGTLNKRLDMFIDIGIGYALLNLVGSLAAVKYLEKNSR